MNTLATRTLLALGLVLATVTVASADTLMFDGLIYDVYFTTPVAVGDGSEGLVAFTIRAYNMTGNSGYDPTSFDGVKFGYTGITSTSGALHQHRDLTDSPRIVTVPAAFAPQINAIDTHFLTDTTATEVVPLSENYLTASSETSYGYYGQTWFGDNLTGSMAIVKPLTDAHIWDIAQVVTNDVSSIEAFFFLSGISGGEIIQIPIPEPATMGLLTLGGLALLKRRN